MKKGLSKIMFTVITMVLALGLSLGFSVATLASEEEEPEAPPIASLEVLYREGTNYIEIVLPSADSAGSKIVIRQGSTIILKETTITEKNAETTILQALPVSVKLPDQIEDATAPFELEYTYRDKTSTYTEGSINWIIAKRANSSAVLTRNRGIGIAGSSVTFKAVSSGSNRGLELGDKVSLSVSYGKTNGIQDAFVILGSDRIITRNDGVLVANDITFKKLVTSDSVIRATVKVSGKCTITYESRLGDNLDEDETLPLAVAAAIDASKVKIVRGKTSTDDDTITVPNTPKDGTVTIYDTSNQSTLIGSYTNYGKPVKFSELKGEGATKCLDESGVVWVTVQAPELGYSESRPVPVYYATGIPPAAAPKIALDTAKTAAPNTLKITGLPKDEKGTLELTLFISPIGSDVEEYAVLSERTSDKSGTAYIVLDDDADLSTEGKTWFEYGRSYRFSVAAKGASTATGAKSNYLFVTLTGGSDESEFAPTPANVIGFDTPVVISNLPGTKDTIRIGLLPVGYTVLILDTTKYNYLPNDLMKDGKYIITDITETPEEPDGVVSYSVSKSVQPGIVSKVATKAGIETVITTDLGKYHGDFFDIVIVDNARAIGKDKTPVGLKHLYLDFDAESDGNQSHIVPEESSPINQDVFLGVSIYKHKGTLTSVYVISGVKAGDSITLYNPINASGKTVKASDDYVVFTGVKETDGFQQIGILRPGVNTVSVREDISSLSSNE